jgi:hypothetical protein
VHDRHRDELSQHLRKGEECEDGATELEWDDLGVVDLAGSNQDADRITFKTVSQGLRRLPLTRARVRLTCLPLMIFPIKNIALVSAAKRTATLIRILSERCSKYSEHHSPRGGDDAPRNHSCAATKSVRDLGARQGAEADTDLVHCRPRTLPCCLDHVRGAHMDAKDATAGRTSASAPATNVTG